MNINLTKPSIDEKELEAVNRVMQSGWLIRGKETQAFEQEVAAYTGAKHAIATNGCTMALYLVVKHMKLQSTDEVIVPSLTWSATASIVIQAGATPVFADVKSDTWCLDPEDVRKKITPRTKLVIPVHYSARYAEGFENFPVPVLFDSAHRIEPNSFNGITSCFSFYAVKNMTTVRGGMIITDSDEAAEWYRMACHGGIAKDTLSRYNGTGGISASAFYYEVEDPGWNFDMTDVEAAIGREQLKKVEGLNKRREEIAAKYNEAFGLNITGNHMYPILVENRDEFLVKMKEAGIQCSIHYLPLHLMKGYKQYNKVSLPNTEFIGAHCASLPLYPDLKQEEIDYIIEQTKKHAEFVK
jgi:dTDP-4-amino-4,6-dideoxygalactose transaminase